MTHFWQAPGNGKAFDSNLEDKTSKMNLRFIGVLTYIKINVKKSGYVAEEIFKSEIKNFLLEKYNLKINKSCVSHFYKPALFFGFIHSDKDKNLTLSIEGHKLLEAYSKYSFRECKKVFINQLDNTKYPNKATPKVKGIYLYPIRILFKLLLEKKHLEIDFIKNKLVKINTLNDAISFLQTGSFSNNLDDFMSDGVEKYNTWIINSFVNLNILKKLNKKIFIDDSCIDYIHYLYGNIQIKDMFFNSIYDISDLEEVVAKKRVKRKFSLITEAKKRDNYSCQVNQQHNSFIANNFNYVEGHHVIPIYQSKNFDFDLDDVNNILSLCPNCHKEVHLADNK